ncbi:hypothetical protein BBJ28_00019500 [Nothophytophthora sp. Chile5]|nr:hypothetical protein BBJ28_00019500 [Nothophytophthora sp. Chile5]
MFWPFLELQGLQVYCPLADFGAQGVREGQDVYAPAVVAQPVTAHVALENARLVRGQIAVLERGRCDFVTKVLHAQQAGAVAVLVANSESSKDGRDEAFVMDAGRLQGHQQLARSVRIPAMMLSHAHATSLFRQIREAELDCQALPLTIRFLGAQTAARVLAQQESLAQQHQHAALCLEFQQQREQQQQEAATLLRNRLGKAVTATVSSSDFACDWSSASSLKSDAVCSTPSSSLESESVVVVSSSGDNQTPEHEEVQDEQSAVVLAMQHWCPLTTALVILDVQNHFTRSHGAAAKLRATAAMEEEDDEPEGRREVETRGHAFYDRVDNVLLPTIQDVLLASRASEGVEIIYSVLESATRDGRERSRALKHAGIHVPRRGFGAQVPKRVAPDEDSDIVLPRSGVNSVFTATNLDYTLRNLMVSHVVVLGISVLGSVEACVQTALDRGYQVTVLREALLPFDTFSREDHTIAAMLDGFASRGVQLLSAAEFVDKLHSFA